jgi:hypothetical protein
LGGPSGRSQGAAGDLQMASGSETSLRIRSLSVRSQTAREGAARESDTDQGT